jgi:hypothetical protein
VMYDLPKLVLILYGSPELMDASSLETWKPPYLPFCNSLIVLERSMRWYV